MSQHSAEVGGITLSYWLYTPKNAAKNMPLIVYLHGGTSKGSDLSKVIKDGFPKYLQTGALGDVPAYVLMPQLPDSYVGWENISDKLSALIDKGCADCSANKSKIALTGHSLGGTGTWKIAAAMPEKFSCAVPMSGSANLSKSDIAALKQLPVWAFVGSDDTIVKPDSSKAAVDALTKAGGNARLTVIDGATHFDIPKAYLSADYGVIAWILAQ